MFIRQKQAYPQEYKSLIKKADKRNYPHFLKKTEILKLIGKKIFSHTATLKKKTLLRQFLTKVIVVKGSEHKF